MDLHIEVEEEEIIVTRPGTDFMVAYRKASDRQNVDVGPMPAPANILPAGSVVFFK